MQGLYGALESQGAAVVAIAQGTMDEAQRFCSRLGVKFPCLGDPDKDSYRAFGLPRAGWREMILEPMRAGNEAVRKGYKVSLRGSLMAHSDWFQLPGAAIVDTAGVVRYLYRSRHAGDLPAHSALLAAVRQITR